MPTPAPADLAALRARVAAKLRGLDRSAPCSIPPLAEVCEAAGAAWWARVQSGALGETPDRPETWVRDRLYRAADLARKYFDATDPVAKRRIGYACEVVYRNWQDSKPDVPKADLDATLTTPHTPKPDPGVVAAEYTAALDLLLAQERAVRVLSACVPDTNHR